MDVIVRKHIKEDVYYVSVDVDPGFNGATTGEITEQLLKEGFGDITGYAVSGKFGGWYKFKPRHYHSRWVHRRKAEKVAKRIAAILNPVSKLRRRVEDHLRKNPEAVEKVANMLNIN